MSDENIIFLKLPNVSLGESVARESEDCLPPEAFSGENETDAGKPENSARAKDDRIDARNMSPDLQDVYKLLTQLPRLSYSSWHGFRDSRNGSVSSSSSVNNFAIRPLTRKIHKSKSFPKADSFHRDENSDDSHPNEKRSREPVKMHQINLYQSILPPYIFTRKRNQ